MLRDNAHKYLKGFTIGSGHSFICHKHRANHAQIHVVEYGSNIGALTDPCLAASHRRAAAPVLPTLAGRNTTVQRLNRTTISRRCILL